MLTAVEERDLEQEQVGAERSLLRDALVGMLVGAVVCAGLWAVMVAIALVGTDGQLGPVVWMGAAVGVFAGLFYGGWVGTMVGCRRLEHVEHETLPPPVTGTVEECPSPTVTTPVAVSRSA
jgi:hypothetical protein